jgi:NADH-quinone oxidoreductase subunit I
VSGIIDVGAARGRKLSLAERLYFPGILKGLAVTMRHLLKNLVKIRNLPTILYPEKKRDYSGRFRGKHILTTRDDGTLKCVACYMCAEACPAECITIVAGEHPKLAYEKYPVLFEIDMLRCVFCGFCVDACPKDAIWMTRNYEMAFFNRQEAIFGIDKLIAKPGLPVKDGLGYRPYYPGDGTRPPSDASSSPVIPGDGERASFREKGIDIHHTEGPGPLNRSLDGSGRGQSAARHQPMVKS